MLVLFAFAASACAAPNAIPNYVYSPPLGASDEQVVAWNTECAQVAAAARGDPVRVQDNGAEAVVGEVGAQIAGVVLNPAVQPMANAIARDDALDFCYEGRGYRLVHLTDAELRQWRSLDTLDQRQAFARQVLAAHPERSE
jgi:hypothetical protein